VVNGPIGDNDYGQAHRAGPDRTCTRRHSWASIVWSWAFPVLTERVDQQWARSEVSHFEADLTIGEGRGLSMMTLIDPGPRGRPDRGPS